MKPRCPICRKPVNPAYKPFCSRRCADVDLARWLRADYVVPGSADEAAGLDEARPDDGSPGKQ